MPDAVVIGSGAAGGTAAWELARAGWSVTVLERGRNLRPGFGEVPSGQLQTLYGSDEIKTQRGFGMPDGRLEPYTTRSRAEAASGVARSAQGALGQLGAAVGGTSMHYNAKFPRFWRHDFAQLSDLGPVDGAHVADWPIGYDDLAPFYDEVEARVGVQGDVAAMPARTLAQSPRSGDFPMPPNPTGYAAQLLAEGVERVGMTAFPYPAAVNSREYDGRPACNSCGLCSSFGCPINARGDAMVSWLNPAVLTGRVRVVERAFAHRIETTRNGRRATGVAYLDADGRERVERAQLVVVAGSPINTARLLLLSATGAHPNGLGNRSDQLGRNIMFHNFTLGAALFAHDVQPLRAQSTTLQTDDLVGPFTGPAISALGVPYVKGGLVQLGSGGPLVQEALMLGAYTGYGLVHKQLMRFGPVHSRVAGSQLIQEDLPQADNRVDLDPGVTDVHGFPAARITYSPHRHEQVGAVVLGARVEAFSLATPGAIAAAIIPYPLLNQTMTTTAHIGGTARMGDDPDTTVCDADGRLHEVDNVLIADASTFPTFPGFNPTLTIMANSLRVTRAATGGPAPPGDRGAQRPGHAAVAGSEVDGRAGTPDAAGGAGPVLPATGAGAAITALPLAAGAAAAASRRHRERTADTAGHERDSGSPQEHP